MLCRDCGKDNIIFRAFRKYKKHSMPDSYLFKKKCVEISLLPNNKIDFPGPRFPPMYIESETFSASVGRQSMVPSHLFYPACGDGDLFWTKQTARPRNKVQKSSLRPSSQHHIVYQYWHHWCLSSKEMPRAHVYKCTVAFGLTKGLCFSTEENSNTSKKRKQETSWWPLKSKSEWENKSTWKVRARETVEACERD